MADKQRGLWFVTDVETSETVEVVEGGRSSEMSAAASGRAPSRRFARASLSECRSALTS
jgi:hypothetical protein